jgi:hypothetical protein
MNKKKLNEKDEGNHDAESLDMMGRERKKKYNLLKMHYKIVDPTVHIVFPWWETCITYPP